MPRRSNNRHQSEDSYSFVFESVPDRNIEFECLLEDEEGELEPENQDLGEYYDEGTFEFEF